MVRRCRPREIPVYELARASHGLGILSGGDDGGTPPPCVPKNATDCVGLSPRRNADERSYAQSRRPRKERQQSQREKFTASEDVRRVLDGVVPFPCQPEKV